jgi:hypothetical protein
MKEVVLNEVERDTYKYVGRSGDHLHRMTDPKADVKSAPKNPTDGSPILPVKTMSLDHGDEVELTLEQYKAFPDRFRPTGKTADRPIVSGTPGDYEPTDADLADTREFNQETAPVHQERRGGNLIREESVIVDRTAGPNAFQGAGSITAEHALAFKEEQEAKDAETERMGSVRGAHKTDPNAPKPGVASAQASGQGPSGTGVLKPEPASTSKK